MKASSSTGQPGVEHGRFTVRCYSSFKDDGPTAKLVRQVLGAVAEFDKAMTVAKLRGARERKRKTNKDKMLDGRTGKCEGRKALNETVPEAVLMAKRLRRANPISGDRHPDQRCHQRQ